MNSQKSKVQDRCNTVENFTQGEINELEKSCRICLQEGRLKDDDNFIAPCGCSGSLKFVHENCLKRWLASVLEIEKLRTKEKLQESHC